MKIDARGVLRATCIWLVTCIIAMGLAGVTAGIASALPTGGNPATINPNAKGELRVVKSDGDPFTKFGDPYNPTTPQVLTPVAGLEFIAQKITGIDLTTNEGWRQAEAMDTKDFAPSGIHHGLLGPELHATTNSDGVAVFSNIDLGLYYVTEVPGPAHERHRTIISPFVVAVPMTDPKTRDKWLYTVTVHAKDQKLKAVKAANRHVCIAKGDDIEYGITGNVPAPPRDGNLSRYEIVDLLSPATTIKNKSSKVDLVDGANNNATTSLDPTTDFTVTIDGDIATMKLLPAGLQILSDLARKNSTISVTWRFNTKVEKIPASGRIENIGYLLVDGYPNFDPATTPGVPTNRVVITGGCDPHDPDKPIIPDPPNPIPVPVPDDPGREYVPVPPPTPKPEAKGPLANTGANTRALIGLGFLLVLTGLVLVVTSRRKRGER